MPPAVIAPPGTRPDTVVVLLVQSGLNLRQDDSLVIGGARELAFGGSSQIFDTIEPKPVHSPAKIQISKHHNGRPAKDPR